MEDRPKEKSWWQTVPGVLTATAGIITAVTGLIVALNQTAGWQEFGFPPVTARYLKVKLRSNYEDVVWIQLYEFQLWGGLDGK